MKTADEVLSDTNGTFELASNLRLYNAIIKAMVEYAKVKCREQQLLAIEHLFDIGQTEFIKDTQEMPYPDFN